MGIVASRVAVLAVAVLAGACGLVRAQDASADAAFARLRVKLDAGDRVTVRLQDGQRVKGQFLDATADALSIATSSGQRRFAPADVNRVMQHRRGILLGSIIGAGIGIACASGYLRLVNNEGGDGTAGAAGIVALGLGAGAGIDALLNLPRTVYRRQSRAAVTFQTGPHRAAAAVAVSF